MVETKSLDQHLTEYQDWRNNIAKTISDYRDWLGETGSQDSLQDLRLYDLAEALKKDKLLLAFVAEFSRGKTELINALFFAQYEERLLPSTPGRTTMCPTEIFWNPDEEPYIKLLPIETRKQDDSIAYLKTTPQAWTKLRLDTESTESMKSAFQSLVQQKEVTIQEAKDLGLWNDAMQEMSNTPKYKTEVPVWRHALINFPHELLKSGLVILDTPGLNALGSEPELTLSIIPNAHAVLFLLSTDTGVTKSDMTVWTQYIRNRTSRKIAVLNKIDILWDELKNANEIAESINSQINTTATQLNLPKNLVFAISAQKALLAKIKNDEALLARSNILALEDCLASNVVAAKHELLRNSIVTETVNMVKTSRRNYQLRITAAKEELQGLESLQGQDAGAIRELIAAISIEKKNYEATVNTYTVGEKQIKQFGNQLMSKIDEVQLKRLIDTGKLNMSESWTTTTLNRNIRKLTQEAISLAQQAAEVGTNIQFEAEKLYQLFADKHGFEIVKTPQLDLSEFTAKMNKFAEITEDFCSSPINVMTEKHFVIKKFSLGLIRQIESAFEDARSKSSFWQKNVLQPLNAQIETHKDALQRRNEHLMHVSTNMNQLKARIADAQKGLASSMAHGATLDRMLLSLMKK